MAVHFLTSAMFVFVFRNGRHLWCRSCIFLSTIGCVWSWRRASGRTIDKEGTFMQLLPGLYQVGGSLSGLTGDQVSGPFDDCNVYVLELSDELVLVDCGNGNSWPEIERNMSVWDLDPSRISTVLLTYSHYDHANAAHLLKKRGVKIVAHPHTADSVASGDERCCGFLYHQQFVPVVVDRMVEDGEQFSIDSASAQSGEEDGLSVLAIHLP